MKRLLIALGLLLANALPALSGQSQGEGCAGATVRQTAVINLSATAAPVTLVSHNGLKVIYLCAVNIGPISAASAVGLVYGTKTTTPCDTGTTGIFTGSTSATEWNFATNGGLTYGNGIGIIGIVPAGQDLCMIEAAGGASTIPGGITYAQY